MNRIPVTIEKAYITLDALEQDVKIMHDSFKEPERITLRVVVTKQVLDELFNQARYIAEPSDPLGPGAHFKYGGLLIQAGLSHYWVNREEMEKTKKVWDSLVPKRKLTIDKNV